MKEFEYNTGIEDRKYWTDLLFRISEPVLGSMSRGELIKNMELEFSPVWDGRSKKVGYPEAFGRLYAFDYYNSFVIHPMYVEILEILAKHRSCIRFIKENENDIDPELYTNYHRNMLSLAKRKSASPGIIRHYQKEASRCKEYLTYVQSLSKGACPLVNRQKIYG